MLNSIIFTITATLAGITWNLYGILANSAAPELIKVVAVISLLTLTGVVYLTVKALNAIKEWQERI